MTDVGRQQLALGDALVTLIDHRGRTPRKLGGSFQTGGIPVISAKNIKDGRILWSANVRHVSRAMYDAWMPQKLCAGDILLTSEAPLGESAYLQSVTEFCLGQRLFALRPNPTVVEPRYLYYLLRSVDVRRLLRSRATGTTAVGIRQSELRRVRLDLPALQIQRAAAAALSSFDDKIELNLAEIATIDALAAAVFRLESARAQEHNDFSIARLSDHLEITRGVSYTGAGLGSGLPLHNLNSIREGGGYKRDGIKYYSGEFRERHIVRPGDVIVANTEQGHDDLLIGYPAIVPGRFGEVGLFSQDTYRVRPKPGSPLTHAFIYLLLRSEPLRSTVAGYANGTTVNHLPAEALARPTFPLPLAERIRILDAQVSPLLAKIEANEDENETLAALRDALLPKLVSGELRVRDAEAVAAAT